MDKISDYVNHLTYDKIVKIIYWMAAFVAPLHQVFGAMVGLITIDFITGVYAAYRNREKISSRKLANTLSKFFIYNLYVLAAWLVSLIVDVIPWLQIVGGYVAVVELKSINENFFKIYGLNFWNVFKRFLQRRDVADAILGDDEKQPEP